MTSKPINDLNQNAARIVRESTADQPLPSDVEAAWQAWSTGVGKVDSRTMALLRAAFEAGAAVTAPEANGTPNSAASVLGKLGASKGGKARAAKLTASKRKAIAKRAAAKRWHST